MAANVKDVASRRALHWVLKIGDRKANIDFCRNVLSMQVLRHEEFEKGCEAFCNGPYDGKWSKTMIGYGPESKHFVLELTYNYNIGSYDYQQDYRGMRIESRQVFARITQQSDYPSEAVDPSEQSDTDTKTVKILSPDGYPFYVSNKDSAECNGADPVHSISLSVSNLNESLQFWSKVLDMQQEINNKNLVDVQNRVLLSYPKASGQKQCQLELVLQASNKNFNEIKPINHGSAFGRVAFACPQTHLPGIEARVKDISKQSGKTGKVITPLLSLDTPGKATVQVVILQDPDGYEICFVGSEAFEQLSKVDPNADRLLDDAIAADKSAAWYAKKKTTKPAAKVEL